jgi:hypothetical protein
MAAEERTPPVGAGDPDEERWARVGRQLLADRLELSGGKLRSEMHAAASKLREGDDLDAAEINDMREGLQQVKLALRLAEESCAETTRTPDPFMYLDEETVAEYAKDANRRPGE